MTTAVRWTLCFHPLLSRRAPVLLPPLQPGLRWPLQPASSPADPCRGEEIPMQRLLSHLQPHVAAAETQLIRLLLHLCVRHREGGGGLTRAQSRGGLLDEERRSAQAHLGCFGPAKPNFNRPGGNQTPFMDLTLQAFFASFSHYFTAEKQNFFLLPVFHKGLWEDQNLTRTMQKLTWYQSFFVCIVSIPSSKYVVNFLW